MQSYPGGKGGAGVYQRLINEIPPHDVYVAAFAGKDAIARHKKPARRNVLIDLDPRPLEWWAKYSDFELHNCDSINWLRHQFGLTRFRPKPPAAAAMTSTGDGTWFVFIDPPYPMSTRTSGPIYQHEMSDDDHRRLLDLVKQLPCFVMITSYWSELYASALGGWRHFTYTSVARSGDVRTEHAWCNYALPMVLHDSRFVGKDKREREKLRRIQNRLKRRLQRMPIAARQSIIDAALSIDGRSN